MIHFKICLRLFAGIQYQNKFTSLKFISSQNIHFIHDVHTSINKKWKHYFHFLALVGWSVVIIEQQIQGLPCHDLPNMSQDSNGRGRRGSTFQDPLSPSPCPQFGDMGYSPDVCCTVRRHSATFLVHCAGLLPESIKGTAAGPDFTVYTSEWDE